MPKVVLSCVLLAGLFAGAYAHAAPTAAPAPAPAPTPTGGAIVKIAPIALNLVSAEVIPSKSRCGEPQRVTVKITNKNVGPWIGSVQLSTGPLPGQQAARSVTLGAGSTDTATQSVEVGTTVPLDCTKPIASETVRVWKQGAEASPLLVKALKPRTVAGSIAFPEAQAPPTDGRPYIQRATVSATCNGPVTASATLVTNSATPVTATATPTFGIYTSPQSVQVRSGAPTTVGLPVPKPLDCQGGGIPTFEVKLLSTSPNHAHDGRLTAYDVTFFPDP